MSNNMRWMAIASLLVIIGIVTTACQPETVVETVVVTVPGSSETIIVTATPVPAEPVNFNAADPNTIVDVVGAGDTDTLDPAWNYESAGDNIISNIYDQLVTYNGASVTDFVPSLAESFEVSEDGLTYTFVIRQGVQFHNGNDLTAEDVAYTFRRGILQGGYSSPQPLFTEPLLGIGTYDISELVSAETGDDRAAMQAQDPQLLLETCQRVLDVIEYDDAAWTVTFHLAQPWGPFLATLAGSWGSIIDKDWSIEQGAWDGDCATWQNYYAVTSADAPLREAANGTNALMLDHWIPLEETVLVANPNFWRVQQNVPLFEGGPVGPSYDRFVRYYVPEWGTRFAMMQAGDADSAEVPRENVSQIDPLVGEWCEWNAEAEIFDCEIVDESAPLRLFIGHPSTARTDMYFAFDINVDGGNPYIGSGQLDGNGIPADFFSDVHVRRAFNYCFDWDAYIADVLAGEAVQSISFMLPGMLGYDPEGAHYTYDPEMCAAELQQAWDGQVWENGFRMQIAYNTGNATRQSIAQILQANFSDIDPKFQIEIIGLPWPAFLSAQRAHRIPIFVSAWGEDMHDPHNWAQPLLVGTYAHSQNMSEEMMNAFNELVIAGVSATTSEARAEIYRDLAQFEFENAPAIRLAVASGRHYEQRWISGYYYNPIYTWQNHYWTLSKQ